MNRTSVASTCLLLGSFCVGGLGLLWFAILLLGVLAGVAGLGGAAIATNVLEYDIPAELLYTGGTFYLGAMVIMSALAIVNLVGGGFGLVAAIGGYRGRTWGLRVGATIQIAMALVFGLPGLVTMNPLALVWLAVLVLGVTTLITTPRAPRIAA